MRSSPRVISITSTQAFFNTLYLNTKPSVTTLNRGVKQELPLIRNDLYAFTSWKFFTSGGHVCHAVPMHRYLRYSDEIYFCQQQLQNRVIALHGAPPVSKARPT